MEPYMRGHKKAAVIISYVTCQVIMIPYSSRHFNHNLSLFQTYKDYLPDGWILLNQTGQEEPAYKNNRDKKSEMDYHRRQTTWKKAFPGR
jgi:hypothetical protein